MQGVLARSSAVLDRLAAEPNTELSVQDVSMTLQLPTSTSHRLLREMLELGWVDQRSPRGGYRLGPRAYALTSHQPYRAQLIQRVQPVMERLARLFELPILLATLRGQRRHTLWECIPEGGTSLHRWLQESDDLLSTSGGRVLLAATKQREVILEAFTTDDISAKWKGIHTKKELREELRSIRHKRWTQIDQKTKKTMSVAFFDQPSQQWFAIGVYGPNGHWSVSKERQLKAQVAKLHS
jgi:DNA-binding IclR family transcriptional regulator